MDGLDRMIEKITREGNEKAENILAASREKQNRILEDMAAESEKECAQLLADAEKKASEQAARTVAAAEKQAAVELLERKNELIHSCIRQALADLKNAPAEEYFSVLLALFEKNCRPEPGVMRLSRQDYARMPRDFADKIAALAREKGGDITVAQSESPLESGFVLEYGKRYCNCSFDELARERSFEIRDEARRVLFP